MTYAHLVGDSKCWGCNGKGWVGVESKVALSVDESVAKLVLLVVDPNNALSRLMRWRADWV